MERPIFDFSSVKCEYVIINEQKIFWSRGRFPGIESFKSFAIHWTSIKLNEAKYNGIVKNKSINTY